MPLSKLFLAIGLVLLCVLPCLFRCETFNCTGDRACYGANITCVEDNPCIIDCIGEDSCRIATLTCKDDQPCYINSDGRSAVRSSTVNCPNDNDCIMDGTQVNHGFRASVVNCGINGSCYFLYEYVTGTSNFHYFTMNATFSRYVKIYKYGNPGSIATVESNIYCPINNDGSGSNCDILCGGASGTTRACDDMNVFAVQGFNDVNITDIYSNNFEDSYMWCTEDYSISCAINSTDPTRCVDTTNICNDYTTS